MIAKTNFSRGHASLVLSIIIILVSGAMVQAQQSSTNLSGTGRGSRSGSGDPIARIRDEGLNRSEVMQTLSYLTDVIGPRLTGSPNLKRANEWTRDKLTEWGLTNAQLEPWGPFGRGWTLQRFSLQVVEPQAITLIAAPKAWTPGLEGPLTGEVVYLNAKNEADLEKHKGKLKGAIVLASSVREVRARWEPITTRLNESNLLRLANASATGSRGGFQRPPGSSTATNSSARESGTNDSPRASASTNITRSATNTARPPVTGLLATRLMSFLAKEGAALVLTASSQGDGGTLFVAEASTGESRSRSTNDTGSTRSRAIWSTNASPVPPQVAVAMEDYNRLVRMIQQGEKLKIAADLQVKFHTNDVMAYNTVAEIPGTDLDEEIVMIGAHMDSWHSGTGATDNGAGVAAAMEAVRILKAANLKPRRTIRVALWTGEEQGLLGSRAYVSQHFGYYTNITNAAVTRSPRDESNASRRVRSGSTNNTTRKLIKQREYERFSAYYNLDNGTGKIRGVYMQGNEGVRPHFRKWLAPFYDLGAETLTAANTGGTDHLSFDGVGLPGFQFIQDPMDYFSRTHHSNADVYDRIQADDMKQAATIMAAFIWNTAQMDEKLPRKPLENN